VIVRVTAFGQTGPYSGRPGFGTLAEAMSGFAATTGMSDGPPMLPPFGLADGITGLTAAFAALVALNRRSLTGLGGEVDISILEPMMMMMGPQISAYSALGYIQPRTGNRSASNAPRNVYQSLDGKWIAISTSSQSIAERVMELVGRPDLISEPWFSSGKSRAEHADLLDEVVGGWISKRNSRDVLIEFENAEAAAAEIYDVSQLVVDPQVIARGSVMVVPDKELGEVSMQNTVFKIDSQNPAIRWSGRGHASDTNEVFEELGFSASEISSLRSAGVIR
jgi:crotonobetainyl-CoA:carnitine CoA-transferase CaiB-like acyl-CoA transferase